MKQYKILILVSNENSSYYKYYQESPAKGDWYSTDKQETIDKILELMKIYSLSEMSLVINLDITATVDIPEVIFADENTDDNNNPDEGQKDTSDDADEPIEDESEETE